MSTIAVEVKNVSKSYPVGFLGRNSKLVLDDVSLNVPEGMIYGVLGPNGAGKTTLLSIMSTLLTQDSGMVTTLGHDTRRQPHLIRPLLGLCSGNPNFIWSMSVAENLTYYAMLYGMGGSRRRSRIDTVIDMLELGPNRSTRFDELSTGTKQRLALAKALLPEPRILFLDEPTLGLDPHMAVKMRGAIRDIHEQTRMTILLTTHYMKEVEEICERVAFLRSGKLAAEGTIEELKKNVVFKVVNPTMEDVFLELIQ